MKSKARFEDQDLYLTVPASFDAVARELTIKAAEAAGLEKITLLEEPQAAFYAWIHREKEKWRKEVRVGESILVCDVGGGTTDFSLIQVTEEKGELALRRVAVGRSPPPRRRQHGPDPGLCRASQAGSEGGKARPLAVPGPLVQLPNRQGTTPGRPCPHLRARRHPRAGDLPDRGNHPNRADPRPRWKTFILDGFFPFCQSTDYPQEKPRVGMREMGLPYESDPACDPPSGPFSGTPGPAQSREERERFLFPRAVLFNGGVMKPDVIRQRVLDRAERMVRGPGTAGADIG